MTLPTQMFQTVVEINYLVRSIRAQRRAYAPTGVGVRWVRKLGMVWEMRHTLGMPGGKL
jgi:hypothetical protein